MATQNVTEMKAILAEAIATLSDLNEILEEYDCGLWTSSETRNKVLDHLTVAVQAVANGSDALIVTPGQPIELPTVVLVKSNKHALLDGGRVIAYLNDALATDDDIEALLAFGYQVLPINKVKGK